MLVLLFVVVSADIYFSDSQIDREAPDSTLLTVSPGIQKFIDDSVVKSEPIVAIQVVTINFQRNVRLETVISIEAAQLQEIYARYLNNKIIETPLFTEDDMNNQRILRLINGEFVCVPFGGSFAAKYAPAAGLFVKQICAMGIPPKPTGFSGIVTLYINRELTRDEETSMFFFIRELSNLIAQENISNGHIRQY
jgi:hypothetical protein